MTEVLSRHYGIPALILIDEYDVPLDKAYQAGYYRQMINLIRSLFSQALKTNPNMYFAVITGCLQIARESIFTRLNNFKVRSISNADCAEYFGFTDTEVRKKLKYYDIEERFPDMKEWYAGYHFGNADVYCPWDVVSQCDLLRVSKDAAMESHWVNSSSNAIVRDILGNATEAVKADIERLISGEAVEKEIVPELTYTDLENPEPKIRQTYLWSVLFASGYLTDAKKPNGRIHQLVIPNKEILGIYEEKVRSWFEAKVTGNSEQWRQFCIAIKTGDAPNVQRYFNEFLSASISIRNTAVRKELKEIFSRHAVGSF